MADVTKQPEVIQKVRPQVKAMITQALGNRHPLVDGVPQTLTCQVFSDENYGLNKFIDIRWSGVSFQKSLWVKQYPIKKENDHIERKLEFRPCLEYHAGDYTCHLTVRDKDGSTFMVNKTKQLKRKYHIYVITDQRLSVIHVDTSLLYNTEVTIASYNILGQVTSNCSYGIAKGYKIV